MSPCGPVVVKIPVVIAETKIIIPVVSEIKLEETAFEIKRIKKNVYVTQCHLIPDTSIKGDFSTTARVCFNGAKPIFRANKVTEEFEMFEDTLKTCDTCAENEIGKDPCQDGFIHNEYFNEKVYCELISAKIVEADIHKNPKLLGCSNPEEQIFSRFTEKENGIKFKNKIITKTAS